MASAGIRCPRGNCHLLNRQWAENVNFFARKPSSVSFCVDSYCSRWRICSSASIHAGMAIEKIEKNKISADDNGSATNAAVVYEKLDEWMKDSVVEIVKNLREAPLLVHVYDEGEKKTRTMKTEKSVEEETWTAMMNSWRKRDTPVPEGVIFVEQLEEKEEEVENDVGEAITRAWGIVVQGKGVDCGPVCYLLKTSRVGSGVGVCCTHFCLMKVKSFRESTRSQLKNFWLLQGQ